MKQVIVNEYLDELEVHPPQLYRRLVELCLAEAGELLKKSEQFIEVVACPACDSCDKKLAFEKYDYTYWICQNCATLFVSPRPSEELMDQYLLDSPVAVFRNSDEYRQTMAERSREMGLYRAEWVSELCERNRINRNRTLVDVETRSPNYLMLFSQHQDRPLIMAKPLCGLSDPLLDTAPYSLTRVNHLADLIGEKAKLITAFDVLEHQTNPFDWMLGARAILDPGGLLVITTRSGSGFDIQVLWEYANIFPVEHINLVSVEGIQYLLTRAGFEVIEVSTPGQLDVQMIERIWREQKQVNLPRFVRYFLSNRDRYAKRNLQQFLQQNLLSSHLRVVARKK